MYGALRPEEDDAGELIVPPFLPLTTAFDLRPSPTLSTVSTCYSCVIRTSPPSPAYPSPTSLRVQIIR